MEQNYVQEGSVIRFFTRNNMILLAGCLIVTIVSYLLALRYGGVATISLNEIFKTILQSDPASSHGRLFMEIRLPLVTNTLLYGVAIGVAGVLLQRATRSTVVCPSTLGIVPACIVAILIALHLFELQNEWAAVLISILGAAFGLLLTCLFSLVIPIQVKGIRLLIGGLATACVLGIVLFILVIKWRQETPFILGLETGLFTIGSLLIPISLVCFILSLCLSGRMNGNDSIWLIAICTAMALILTGTAVATSGVWVMAGLIASTIARGLTRKADYRILIPVSAMIGASIMTLLKLLSYLINPPLETPLNMMTGLIGLPLLVLLIWKEAVRYSRVSQADRTTA
ncbi:iron chelate uptake ABC transporter family permease subunit [Paenibacillus gorillae]|uniref:iron chelate uptake ABC transporter family permease subunit n=1 Tax=Paenibacillus gorillae TaxID=1243662 RepID=UPI0004AC741C|nr:iron chelate uptake ABC transporter family permease subunit [Paenibacillus gorillae]